LESGCQQDQTYFDKIVLQGNFLADNGIKEKHPKHI